MRYGKLEEESLIAYYLILNPYNSRILLEFLLFLSIKCEIKPIVFVFHKYRLPTQYHSDSRMGHMRHS